MSGTLESVKVQIKQNSGQAKSRQDPGAGCTYSEDLNAVMTDSLDFENSDDLNKIIQKYETMLSQPKPNESKA